MSKRKAHIYRTDRNIGRLNRVLCGREANPDKIDFKTFNAGDQISDEDKRSKDICRACLIQS